MKTIVCVDSNWGIGSNNDLLYHIPADMKYFKEKTMGNVVVMGMATVLSLPGAKPLPGRTTVALSDDPDWAPEGVIVCRSIDEMLEKLKEFDTDSVYICGGASVYAQMIDFCDTAYITKVYACDKDAEKFFPDMDKKPGWHIAEESDYMEYNDLVFRFLTYKKDENITADN